MKRKIFKNWNLIRFFWLTLGIGIAITAVVLLNYFLLFPALYFILGAILNIGCFGQSCAVDFKKKKETESID